MLHRRKFLKLVGLSSIAAAIRIPFSVAFAAAAARTVSAGGLSYRWDGTGRVYVSDNNGKSWALHSDIGSKYSIMRLTADRTDRIHSQVDYRGRTFELILAPNLRSWLTT